MRHHFGITENRRAVGECIAGRGNEIAAKDDMARHVNLTASVDHAHDNIGFVRGKARQIGFGADDGE